jgi:glycosyltransferase involved in cell wall biosynthesis
VSRKSLLDVANTFDNRLIQRMGRVLAKIAGLVNPRQTLLDRLPAGLAWRAKVLLYGWKVRTQVYWDDSRPPADLPYVLLVTHDLSASGAPRVLAELGSLLLSNRVNVIVLSFQDGPFRERLVEMGAIVVTNAGILMPYSSLAKKLARKARVAICNTVLTAQVVREVSAVVSTIWYIHEVSILTAHLEEHKTLADTFALPRLVWAGSELSAALIRPFRESVRVLPYGLDPLGSSLNRVPGLHDGPLRIAVFGTFERRKGQDLAVEAIHLLSPVERSAVELSLYGRVLQPEFFTIVEAALARTPEASFCGDLDAATYEAEAAAVDAVLVPSRDDTLPLVSLDALGAGRVLMCTPTTGTSAYLHSGVDSFVSATADPESIAAMLSAAIARRAEWPAIGNAGEALFTRTFSKTAFSKCILEAIEPFLGEAKIKT